MSELGITTKEAGRILGVHESSIKRWCDNNSLAFSLTAGGHRRVSLDAVITLGLQRNIRSHLLSLGEDASDSWEGIEAAERTGDFGAVEVLVRQWLDNNDVDRPFHLCQLLLERGFDLPDFMDEVLAPIMRQVGDEWADGVLRIADEHRMTSLVVSLLHRLAHECDGTVGADASSRVAIVACLPSVAHELGALMAHLVLRSQGWKTHYLGLGLPVEDVSDFQAKSGAQLVCLSVAPPRGMPEVRQAADLLARLYRPESPYRLAFGGSGIRHTDEFDPFWFESLGLFDSTRQFSRWLTEQND